MEKANLWLIQFIAYPLYNVIVRWIFLSRAIKKKRGERRLRREYISGVKPLENYILKIDFVSGSSVLLDMTPFMEKLRFRPLKKPEVWSSAETNGIFVRFGGVEISHDEIIEMVEGPNTEGNYEN